MSEEASDRTLEVGKGLAKEEFENFLKGREVAQRRYETIVRCLSRGPSSWSEIKGAIEATEGKTVNDRNMTELLTTLVKAGFGEKGEQTYSLADPMLRKAFA